MKVEEGTDQPAKVLKYWRKANLKNILILFYMESELLLLSLVGGKGGSNETRNKDFVA